MAASSLEVAQTLAQGFVQHYYPLFDNAPDGTARATNLANLYDNENSILIFEGISLKGKQAILEKYSTLPFRSIQRGITKIDAQPLSDGSVLISVLGQLKTDEDPPQSFVHVFVLRSAGGVWFISNEVFRLVLHNI